MCFSRKVLVFIKVINCLLVTALAVGCGSSQPVTLTEYRDRVVQVHDTLHRVDSTYIHDSIVIERRGDTVYIDRVKTAYRYLYRDRWRDSIVIQHDSIDRPVVVEVEKKVEVEKPLTFLQQAKMHLGAIAFWALIAIAGIFIIKRKIK